MHKQNLLFFFLFSQKKKRFRGSRAKSKIFRDYYRCTHRHSQGCAATKQVQRTDEDPTFFDVMYLGDHTCVQSQRASAAAGQAAADAQAPEYKYNAKSQFSSPKFCQIF